MGADGGVALRDAVRAGVSRQGSLFQINFTKKFSIGRRDHFKSAGDALASCLFQLRFRRGSRLQFLCPAFERGAFRCAAAIVIDHRVAQDAIEPGDGGFVGAQSALGLEGLGLKRTHIRRLQNVFCDGAIFDAALDKCEEAPAQIEQ